MESTAKVSKTLVQKGGIEGSDQNKRGVKEESMNKEGVTSNKYKENGQIGKGE